jgi:ribose transport system permease protein
MADTRERSPAIATGGTAVAPRLRSALTRPWQVLREDGVGQFFARYGLSLVLGFIIVGFFIMEPRILSVSNLVNVSRTGAALAILATGMAFVLVLGHVDISVGSTVGAASVLTAWGAVEFGVAGMVLGPLIGCVVGLINGFIVARFGVHSVIVTIGMLTALRGWTLWMTNGAPIFEGLPDGFRVLGTGFVGSVPVPVVVAAVVMLAAAFVLRSTPVGPLLYAIGGNEEAAKLAGINTFRLKVVAFMITGALAGLTGTLLSSRISSGQPNLGQLMELDAIAAAVIGGMALTGGRGRIGGVFLGVAVLTMLQNGLNLTNVSSFVQQMAIGMVIIAAVVADSVRQRGEL